MAKTPRERIGEALYMLAAGADEAVFVKTLQTYVAVHSQTEDQVAEQGLGHGLCTLNAEAINADLLAFVQS